MIVGGVSQLIERFGLDEDELTAKSWGGFNTGQCF